MPFGTGLDEKSCRYLVDSYYDIGGNLIDTANLYGGGLRGNNAFSQAGHRGFGRESINAPDILSPEI